MTKKHTGFDYEASARRVVGTYLREDVDRVPIYSPIGWHPSGDIDAVEFGDWRDEERFRRIGRLVQQYCDIRPTYSPVGYPRVFEPQSYQRFLEAPQEYVEALPPEKLSDIRTRYTSILHTPKGDLTWYYDEDFGVFTKWDMKKPIEKPEDVDAMLSFPADFVPPDPAEFEAFRQHRRAMGRYATGGAGINSMVAMLVGVMDYELVLDWMMTEPQLIRRLADAWLERVGARVDFLLAQGVGPFWHFNGVERAAPPMMSPKMWAEWVEGYDGEIMRRIKAADPEARIHVHCHGKVNTVIDSFYRMGVDSTDPVEPPPQGDADMYALKQEYDGRMVFVGNIEFLWIETMEPDELEEMVRRAIEEGGKKNVILMPSAGPHERPSDRCLANCERYIEAGIKYGTN